MYTGRINFQGNQTTFQQLLTKSAFEKSELAGRTMTGPAIL